MARSLANVSFKWRPLHANCMMRISGCVVRLASIHDKTWGDGNGYAHLRAALIGPSISVPIVGHNMTLGTWQQIVLIDFDNRARQRRLVVQILGN